MNTFDEDHLLIVIDSFIDFSNHVFILGYDLRIDAYSYCRFPLHAYVDKIETNSIYQVEKTRIENTHNSRNSLAESYFYKIRKISAEDLNPIEKIYYTHFNKKKSLSPTEELKSPTQLSIHVGTIENITPVASVIGASQDLTIAFPKFNMPITTRTQDLKYQIKHKVVALIKTIPSSQGDVITVLGLKDRSEVEFYLEPQFLERKNQQILDIDYR